MLLQDTDVLVRRLFLMNKMKNLIKKIGRGIAPLVLSGALAAVGCAGNPAEINGVNGRDTRISKDTYNQGSSDTNGKSLNPKNAKQFSDLDIPTQVEYFFKVPVKKNKY